jgi:hypothetical protein
MELRKRPFSQEPGKEVLVKKRDYILKVVSLLSF